MWWWPWSSRRGRSVQVKLIKMGGRLVRHSRRLIFQLSEVSVPRRLFQGVLDRRRMRARDDAAAAIVGVSLAERQPKRRNGVYLGPV